MPATHHKPPALRGLVDTDDELTVLAEVEGLTSGRLLAERGRNPHLDPRELAWRRRNRDLAVYGDTHVNAAFVYTRAGGNRFNSDERGAWYCAWDVLVSVSEVAWHRTRELGYAGSFNDSARYVELLADFIGEFNDITDEPRHPALNPDPEIGYPEGQSLARHLRREGSRGLIYPSVRAPHPGGELSCLLRASRHPECPPGGVLGSRLGWNPGLFNPCRRLISLVKVTLGNIHPSDAEFNQPGDPGFGPVDLPGLDRSALHPGGFSGYGNFGMWPSATRQTHDAISGLALVISATMRS